MCLSVCELTFILYQRFLKNYVTKNPEILYTWQVWLVVLWERKLGLWGQVPYLFPFVVLAICVWVNIYFVSKISQEQLYLESWNLVHMTSMTSCIVGKKIGAVGSGHLELFPFVVLAVCVWVNIYFVSEISQELLYLESWNFVHMTKSMTSCIVGKKIGVMGSGP